MFELVKRNRNRHYDIFNESFGAMEEMFNNFFNRVPMASSVSPIKVDIKDTEQAYIVEAEIVGVSKEDIEVNLEDNVLSINVKKEDKKEEEKVNYLLKERRSSSISRQFYIEDVDVSKVTAIYDNGILTITLPKLNPDKNKSTKIKIN